MLLVGLKVTLKQGTPCRPVTSNAKFEFNPSRHFCDTVWKGSVTALICVITGSLKSP